MIIELGVVAGQIWRYLEKNKKVSLSELTPKIGSDRDKVLMGLGWMTREGHVILEREGNEYSVSLRQTLE